MIQRQVLSSYDIFRQLKNLTDVLPVVYHALHDAVGWLQFILQ